MAGRRGGATRGKASGPYEPGVYVYTSEGRARVGELKLSDGVYALYFHNNKCPSCRRFSSVWDRLVRDAELAELGVRYVLVASNWFAKDSPDPLAARLFREYGVTASPTVILLRVSKGAVVFREELVGARGYDELKRAVREFVALRPG